MPHEVAARLTVAVGDGHASRVVEENAQKVLLRHRRLEDERRSKEAENENGEGGEPQRDQDGPVSNSPVAGYPPISEQRGSGEGRGGYDGQRHRSRHGEREVALLENQGRKLEQEPEQRVEHKTPILLYRGPVQTLYRGPVQPPTTFPLSGSGCHAPDPGRLRSK